MDKPSALATLDGRGPGAFVIRASDKSFAAISLLKPDGKQFHQHIEQTGAGLQIKKTESAHHDIDALVAYFCSTDGGLPTKLSLY